MAVAPRLTQYSHGAGCACKLSPAELLHVLGAIPTLADPNVLAGMDRRDDAAVYRIDADRALVATVDFFTPIVDDPSDFGAIAAANALSDVYVTGGRPLFALGMVAFPRGELDRGLLERIVEGGARKLAEARVPVVGGHSVDDPEPKFGYAVVGEVEPSRLVGHEGGQPGDLLYLTKPLGIGVVTTAVKGGSCPEEVAAAAIALMTHLNRRAGWAVTEVGAKAATDVTGYGLLGHLRNLGVGADIEASRVPFLPGARELAAAGIFPGGSRRNWESVRQHVAWGGLPEAEQLLLADAQTSGGILAAIPEPVAERFEELLASEPYPATCIGRVNASQQIQIV